MKIASIDRHPILRIGLSVFLRNYFRDPEILESDCINSFMIKYEGQQPDVVIIGLPEETKCLEMGTLTKMMQDLPGAAFIIYAGNLNYGLALSCLKSGVKGFVLKNSSTNDLAICIEKVMQGSQYVSGELADIFDTEYYSLYELGSNRPETGALKGKFHKSGNLATSDTAAIPERNGSDNLML